MATRCFRSGEEIEVEHLTNSTLITNGCKPTQHDAESMNCHGSGPRCPLCDSPDAIQWFLKREVPYYRCDACAFVYSVPGRNINLENEYNDFESAYLDYLSDQPEDEANFRDLSKWISRCRDLSGARLLDVGCGSGKFVRYLRRNGVRAFGTEPSRALFRQFLSDDALFYNCTLEELSSNKEAGEFEIITALDVVEHVCRPRSFFASAASLLSPSGLMVISTPDVDSLWARVSRKYWHHFNDYHWSYFSEETLSSLACAAGFQKLATSHRGRVRSVGYVFRYACDFLFMRQPPRLAELVDRFRVRINLFDTMYLCFRKAPVLMNPRSGETVPDLQKNNKFFYEEYASEYDKTLNFFDLERRREVIFDELGEDQSFQGKLVLDAGSGTGWLSETATKRGARVVSMDLGPRLASASRHRSGSLASAGDVTHLPFRDGVFDVVICAEVIEHIEEQDDAVRELSRVLKPGGVLLLTTPNSLWYFAVVMANALKLRPYEGIENWVSERSLDRMLGKSGMEVTRWSRFNLFPVFTHLVRRPPHIVSSWAWTLERTSPHFIRRLGLNVGLRAVRRHSAQTSDFASGSGNAAAS